MLWARDFGTDRRLEAQEYWMYCKLPNGRTGAKDPTTAADGCIIGSCNKKRPASTLTRRYRPWERNPAKVLPVLYILSEKGEKINITGGTTMKKTRIFSLIALVLAMLMVFAACAPAATDTKSNDS